MQTDVREFKWAVKDTDEDEIVGAFREKSEAENYAEYRRERDETEFEVHELYLNFDTSASFEI